MSPLTDAAFWEVFHQSRTPMLLFDDTRRYSEANAAACDALGRSRDDVLKARAGDRTAGDLQRRLDEVHARVQEGEPVTERWAFVRPDGERREVLMHVHPNAVDEQHLLLFLSAPPRLPAGGLTPREREITTLLADGCDGREIAERLVLSPETVRTHIRNAMERAGARTRAHLIAIALRERLIDP